MADAPQHKIHLTESEMPTTWYNIVADLPEPPPPPLHPGTLQPATPDDFAPLFPMALIEQEATTDRYVEIPGEVLDIYRVWRPSPLFRATRLEQEVGTPDRIYYKHEGVSPAGSHEPKTSAPHYDITGLERDRALRMGAIAVSRREIVALYRRVRIPKGSRRLVQAAE